MRSSKLPAVFGLGTTIAALVALLVVVHAHPVWHDLSSRGTTIDSLVTGSSSLLAGGVKFDGVPSFYLTTPSPPGTRVAALGHAAVPYLSHEAALLAGSTGNLAVSFLSSPDGAPLFSVHNGQLLHHANESHILYVNAFNVTRDTPGSLPFRLTLANRRDGLLDAVWRWRGAFLYLDDGDKSNNGLYYKCMTLDDGEGVFTSFDL